jgi:hypothetical protein
MQRIVAIWLDSFIPVKEYLQIAEKSIEESRSAQTYSGQRNSRVE